MAKIMMTIATTPGRQFGGDMFDRQPVLKQELKRTFQSVYADRLIAGSATKNERHKAGESCQLQWLGPRVTLEEAVNLYDLLVDGYGLFRPSLLKNLLARFPDGGIEVTPGRQFSVVVFLYVPSKLREDVERYILRMWRAHELSWNQGELRCLWAE